MTLSLRVNVAAVCFVTTSMLGAGAPLAPTPHDVAPLGSSNFQSSPEHPVGWRGDGSGQYPGATPPVHWGRHLKQLGDLKCAATVPKDNSSQHGTPAYMGFFTEWLVAGPLSRASVTNAIKEELLPGEATFAPQAGDPIAETTWRAVKVEDSFVNVRNVLGGMPTGQAAYAQACLYTERPLKIWFHFNHVQGVVFWLNGVSKWNRSECETGPTLALDLRQGWNRFLFKVTPHPDNCSIHCRFWPAEEPRDYEQKNIAWILPMPGLSQSTPVLVGKRIFTMAYPYNLVAVDKQSGKILWIRQNSPYDAATTEDRKAKPNLFTKMDELAAKRDAYYRDYMTGKMPNPQEVKAESEMENDLDKRMEEIDEKYKKPWQQGEPDWWTIPTPVSDGHGIAVWLTRGVSAAYDLDGQRKWIRYERPEDQHHGYAGSPVIADGKLIIMDGRLTALDLADGSVKWSIDDGEKPRHGSGQWFSSLCRGVVGGTEYIHCSGGLALVRARDGKVFGRFAGSGHSTPIFDGNLILRASNGEGASYFSVQPGKDGDPAFGHGKHLFWQPPDRLIGDGNILGHHGDWLLASPLLHEGLGYTVSGSGVLAVFDATTMEHVYEQVLPLDLFHAGFWHEFLGASVTMAGPYIYILGSTGVAIVIKPGRRYEEVARNRIQYLANVNRAMGYYGYYGYNPVKCPEYQDCTMTSTPIFEGTQMYFRGEESLYCVEETAATSQTGDTSKTKSRTAR